ncbi:hypothetical protein BC940DRAFT_287770 [Gongronella butleri]|nr:hypothetical protein BC940DRAFT_287770 [Gongronella butleri]
MVPPPLHHRYSLPVISCSASSSFTPLHVEPPTTKTQTSSFSEIEPVNTFDTFIPPQLHIHHESFLSPLTETNLEYHKSTFPSSREAKKRYVDSYIQHQRALLEQELNLQRQIKQEMSAMIPLDHTDQGHELIADIMLSSSPPLPPLSPPAPTPPTTPHANKKKQKGSGNSLIKRPRWLQGFADWVQRRTRPTPTTPNADGQGSFPDNEEHGAVISGIQPMGRDENNENDENDEIGDFAMSAVRRVSLSPQHAQVRAARHVSWCVGTSYEEYKKEKLRLMQQTLQELGTPRASMSSASPHTLYVPRVTPDPPSPHMLERLPPLPASPTTSSPAPSTPTTPQQHQTPASPSSPPHRDSAITFMQQTRSLLRTRRLSLMDNEKKAKNQQRTRRHSLYWHFWPPLKEDAEPDDQLKAFRYPRMIQKQVMRDTALQMLVGSENEPNGRDRDAGGSAMNPAPVAGSSSGATSSVADTSSSGQHDNLASKRYSEPLQLRSLQNPPFPIGRPLSTMSTHY